MTARHDLPGAGVREIALDTETTGFDPHGSVPDRMTEIGMVEMVDGRRTGLVWHAYVDPERDVPAKPFSIHGLSRNFLRSMPPFRDVARSFLDFIGDSQLVIHNAPFDMKFIQAELVAAGFAPITNPVVDTLVETKRRLPGAQATLDALCRRFGIDKSGRTVHGALIDAELLADVWEALEWRKVRALDLRQAEVQEDEVQAGPAVPVLPVRPDRGIGASTDEEYQRWSTYMAGFKTAAVWRQYLAHDDVAEEFAPAP